MGGGDGAISAAAARDTLGKGRGGGGPRVWRVEREKVTRLCDGGEGGARWREPDSR